MTRRLVVPAALLGAALLGQACSKGGGATAPAITMPSLQDHSRFFPIAAGDAHGPPPGSALVQCNACHYDVVAGAPSASFRTFTCTGCHGDTASASGPHTTASLTALVTFHTTPPAQAKVDALAAKVGMPFATDDASCLRCHPQGIAVVDHTAFFPLPHRDAAGTVVARCADCHVQPGDRTVLGCASCHPHDQTTTDALHASVPDFADLKASGTSAQLSTACVRCHPDGVTAVRVADHPNAANGFLIEGGARHSGPLGGKCLSCHPALGTNPDKPLAADFKVTTCVGCHDASGGDVPVGGGATTATHSDQASLQGLHDAMALVPDPTPGAPPGTSLYPKAAQFAATVTAQGSLSAACVVCHPTGDGIHPFFPRPHHTTATTPGGDCADCHTDPPARLPTALGCAACHAARAPVATHHAGKVVDVASTDASAAASALCVRCHDNDVTSIRVAAHLPFDVATSKHSAANGQKCLDCHTGVKGEPTPWAADFKVTGCVGCHVPVAGGKARHDTWSTLVGIHPGVSGFPATQPASDAAFSAACLNCHPSGSVGPPADHGDFFDLSAAGRHPYPSARITKCLDCHTSANRTTTTDFACATCHASDPTPMATGHAAVPDYAADPQNPVKCLACHANGRLPAAATGVTVTVAGHATTAAGFTVGTGAHAGAAGGACLVCHPVNRTPSTLPPHWDYARDFKQTTCVGCHVAVGGSSAFHDDVAGLTTLHSSVTTFTSTVTAKGLSAACLYCHADGAGGAPANHPLLFPIGVGTSHAGIACSSCHLNPANRQDLTAFGCATCHNGPTVNKTVAAAHAIAGYAITTYLTAATAGGSRTTVQIDMTDSRTCLRCHADSQVDRVAVHPGGDSAFGTGRHLAGGCLTCHAALRTAGTPAQPAKPWAADFTTTSGSAGPPPSGCYVCHASGSGGGG